MTRQLAKLAMCAVSAFLLVHCAYTIKGGGTGGEGEGTPDSGTSEDAPPVDPLAPGTDAGPEGPDATKAQPGYVVAPITASCTARAALGNALIQTSVSYPHAVAGTGPFPITLWGKPMASIGVAEDGYVKFFATPTFDYSLPGVLLHVFNDDHRLYGGGGLTRVYAALVGGNELVIQWDRFTVGATDHYGPGSGYQFTMEAHLFSSGVVETHYCSGFGPAPRDTGSTARIGIEDQTDPDNTILAADHQANAVINGQGYRFTPTP